MKKFLFGLLISLSCIALLAFLAARDAFATGVNNMYPPNIVGVNPQQSGSFSITNLIPIQTTNTITFPFPFYTAPVMSLFQSSTNGANNPLTNSITATNFTVVTTSTNTTVSWFANVGYTRLQTGTNAITAAVLLTNTFSPPFFYPPIVQLTGSATNSEGQIGLVSVTTSNFVMDSTITQTVYWGALGIAAAPGYTVPTF